MMMMMIILIEMHLFARLPASHLKVPQGKRSNKYVYCTLYGRNIENIFIPFERRNWTHSIKTEIFGMHPKKKYHDLRIKSTNKKQRWSKLKKWRTQHENAPLHTWIGLERLRECTLTILVVVIEWVGAVAVVVFLAIASRPIPIISFTDLNNRKHTHKQEVLHA